MLHLKSGHPGFKPRPDHELDLFQVVPGSTPLLHLYLANSSSSCQLGLVTCSVQWLCTVAIFIVVHIRLWLPIANLPMI